MIYYFTGIVVWVSIISTGFGILALAMLVKSYRSKHYGLHRQTAKGQALADQNTGKALRFVVYGLYGLTGAYFLAICCLWKNIAVSVAVLKTSAVIIFKNLRILLMPFFSALCLLTWCIYWATTFGYLLSTGQIVQPKLGSQLKRVSLNEQQWHMVYG